MVRVLTRAFSADPIESWCMTCDDPVRLVELELLQVTRQLTAVGALWVTDDVSGVAAWLPPDVSYDEDAIDAVVSPVLAAHGGSPARSLRFWRWVDDHRPAVPHWYLDLVAVDPDRRGMGLGRLLLENGLARADARGEPVFLVTASPETARWYERHGFVIRSKEAAPEAGPWVWFMCRSPSQSGAMSIRQSSLPA